ncbi:hypothetical protein Agub_g3227 [Astrephomene gubernaculifera]|uniref:Uncharacterized protein n=1 Tax=Astrephomene gubernaculifera TaxID=47775 RepID=A0AAD3HJ65_9CHLO|nr:hypothetical protein Agub_g3227 [Astrephomene gubernaculifera]
MSLTLRKQQYTSGRHSQCDRQICKPNLRLVLPYRPAPAPKGPCVRTAAAPNTPSSGGSALDIRQLSDIITSQALESEEKQHSLAELAGALGESVGSVKLMVFRQKALLGLGAEEVRQRVQQVAEVVEVPYEKARQMCVIQPSLLTDTQRQAEALRQGLRIICHDLRAEKEEIVELLISNPSLLHGRQMRLSAADMAHLALLREPRGRIVD